jgi:DNA helicase IV
MPYQFQVPPANKLSYNQRQALGFPLNGNECLLITGCPGSGKTTVANFRASNLHRERKRFIYIIYARMLESYVRHSFKDPALNIIEDKVSTFASWFFGRFRRFIMDGPNQVRADILLSSFRAAGRVYDEMILDEAQDLDIEIIKNLPIITDSVTICADDAQAVFGGDAGESLNSIELIKNELESKNVSVHPIHLGINYRNTPEIYAFAKAFVPDNPTGEITSFMKEPGQKPILAECNSKTIMMERIENIVSTRRNENIGILCDKVDHLKDISGLLKSKMIEHTCFHSYMPRNIVKEELKNLKGIVVCTNKSAKGLEFQTVIVPFVEDLMSDETHRKCYYVAFTRAERNLFLLTSCIGRNMPLISQINKNLYEKI